jgi:hypothetical protein
MQEFWDKRSLPDVWGCFLFCDGYLPACSNAAADWII